MALFIREITHIIHDPGNTGIGGGIHPYHELLYICSGEVQVDWIGHSYRAAAPALFIVTPSSPHRIEKLSSNCDFWFVEMQVEEQDFAPELEIVRRWNALQGKLNWQGDALMDIRAVIAVIERIVNYVPHQTNNHFRRLLACDVQRLLLLIDYHIQTDGDKEHTGYTADKWSAHSHIYSLIRYMEHNYNQNINLHQLAGRSGFTPSYVIRLYKEMTGLTPLQYLLELRMNAAISYLQTTSMSVQDIAHSVGFPSIHYFSRIFKQKFGNSPTEWKKKHLLPVEHFGSQKEPDNHR